MRGFALIVAVLGLVVLIFGILFIVQSSSARQQVADSIAPLTLDQIDAKYDLVASKYDAIKTAEEPKIQAGQAAASDTYNYLSAQRALLGLAKSNIGIAGLVKSIGIVNIILGIGLILTCVAFFRNYKGSAANNG